MPPQYLSRDPYAGTSSSGSSGSSGGRRYLSTDPRAGGFGEPEPERKRGWGDYAGLALRGLSGIIGAPGGLIGSASSAIAELPAQFFERTFGSRESYEPLQIATQAGLGAIPFGKVLGAAKGAGAILRAGGKGAVLAGGSAGVTEATRQIGTGEDLDVGRIGQAATTGGVIGAVGGSAGAALAGKFLGRGKVAASAEDVAARRSAYRQARGYETPPQASAPLPPPDPMALARGRQRLLPFDLPEQDIEQAARESLVATSAQRAGTSRTMGDLTKRMDVLLGKVRRMEETGTTATESLAGASQRPLDFMMPAASSGASKVAAAAGGAGDDVSEFVTAMRAKYPDLEDLNVQRLPTGDLRLEQITVREGSRGGGTGSKVIEELSGLADRQGKRVTLAPELGENQSRLENFYSRFGFKPNQGESYEDLALGGMIREPGAAAAAATPRTAAGIAQKTGKTFIPAELVALQRTLKPKWAQASAETGVPTGEDLLPFARRVLGEPNERKLMWGERQAMRQVKAKGKPVLPGTTATAVDRDSTLGRPLGDGPGDPESGQISRELMMRLGLGGAGAAVGAASDDENPVRGALGYGTLGALSPSLFTKKSGELGKSISKLRYFSMLGKTSAQAKNIIGNAGSVTVRAGEELLQGNTEGAKKILSNVFTPETARKVVAAFKQAGKASDSRWGSTSGTLGIPSRVMHAVDEGVTESLKKAGISGDEAKNILFTGTPRSKWGRWAASRPGEGVGQALMPFVRTATNIIERGLEHTPGVAMLPAVRAMRNPTGKQLAARQAMGALAALAGGTVGSNNPYVGAALGPLALPYEAGGAARRAFESKKRGDPLSKLTWEEIKLLTKGLPIPNDAYDFDPGRYLASFVPGVLADASLEDPRNFDTSGSIFDPAIAKIPGLNEALLPKRVRRRPPPR
jgi:GNAT superfamily N-acetyltransferase